MGPPATLRHLRTGREGVPVCDGPGRRSGPPLTAAGEPHARGRRGAGQHAADHRQRAGRGRADGADEGRPPQPGAIPGHLVRPAGRLLEADRAVRASVPVAPRGADLHPQRRRRLLVGPCHARLPAGQELRHLARTGVRAGPRPTCRGACRTSRPYAGLRYETRLQSARARRATDPPYRTAVISARIASAVSAGCRPPRSRPIGPCTRAMLSVGRIPRR